MLDKTHQALAEETLSRLNDAFESGDLDGAVELFRPDCFWRDLVSFTWNIETVEGQAGVRELLESQLSSIEPSGFRIDPAEMVTGGDDLVEAWIEFETGVGRGYGHMRLKEGRIWTFLTTLKELKGFEERDGPRRSMGAEHGASRDRKTWKEQRETEASELGITTQPYCLIVGGGQGGIALGARLRQLDGPTIIVEKNDRPGDSWRNRYKSLCLHDPVWYDHLPYLPFPKNWPVFSPKNKLGDWLEMYTRVMELNYWGSTEVLSSTWNEADQNWTVIVNRNGETLTLHPTQLVLATGMSGKKNVPVFPGQDVFAGEQQHSSEHPGPDAYKGKKVVVIGSNNSAHDICAALWEGEADVTMVQRSSTHIVRSDTLMEIGLGALYSEEAVAAGVTTEKADLIFASLPYRILHEFQIPLYQQMKERDKDFYDALEKAGFMLDWGDDDSGLFMKYLRRGSGYYIDVGASQLLIDGKVKLESGSGIKELTKDAVVLENGKSLPADLVIYATGYGSMNGWAADLISPEVAEKVGKCWGLGSDTTKDPGPWEGEQRNMWKPTAQPSLWFHGGNLHQSRHYSQFLALQIKARKEGLATPVHKLQPSHHKS